MHACSKHKKPACDPHTVHHYITCRHQAEVEVWPAKAEVYFRNERYTDPINTQVRFDAVVYNAPTSNVTWQVTDINGNPGAGTIDASGLYKAPPKESIPHGHTDIVIVRAADDPMRMAWAQVTLVGHGPEIQPLPKLEIFPKYVNLYNYSSPSGTTWNNTYIDYSNKKQLFRVILQHTDSINVKWYKNGTKVKENSLFYEYISKNDFNPANTEPVTINIRAELTTGIPAKPVLKDEAVINLQNYRWPGYLIS